MWDDGMGDEVGRGRDPSIVEEEPSEYQCVCVESEGGDRV